MHSSVGAKPTTHLGAIRRSGKKPVTLYLPKKKRQHLVRNLTASSFRKWQLRGAQFKMAVAKLRNNPTIFCACAQSALWCYCAHACGSKALRLTPSAAPAVVERPPKANSLSPGLSIAHHPSRLSG